MCPTHRSSLGPSPPAAAAPFGLLESHKIAVMSYEAVATMPVAYEEQRSLLTAYRCSSITAKGCLLGRGGEGGGVTTVTLRMDLLCVDHALTEAIMCTHSESVIFLRFGRGGLTKDVAAVSYPTVTSSILSVSYRPHILLGRQERLEGKTCCRALPPCTLQTPWSHSGV